MRDRLTSVKTSRTIRNISLCLCLIFLLEFLFLLIHSLIHGHKIHLSPFIFLFLAALTGYLTYYYHHRFRSRE